ncbi:YdeI/OmpD-associated family protein [Niabella sp. W65]|nr:YdeI/OmpD-associated family protein [Niabella sp. W65]MCH7367536.1 YdeI/OmpD-associated family protein [Niabella sp. W65]
MPGRRPACKSVFASLAPSHQNYFSKWIDDAKTDATKTKRIAQALFGLNNKMDYGQMIRYHRGKS